MELSPLGFKARVGNPTVMRDTGDPQLGCTLLSISSQRLVFHIHINIPFFTFFFQAIAHSLVSKCLLNE